jgi:RsiW-degrading membrane proteinase PrsW (M82 family)
VNIFIALSPVVAFLVLLQLMDSFRLVTIRAVLSTIAFGAGVAILWMPLHTWLLTTADLDLKYFSRYIAPLTEEFGKASVILVLFWRRRIGFLVDAAVLGFAVGAGFALVENADYLIHLENPSPALWLVRGFGTAVLHGATTAVFAMVTRVMLERPGRSLVAASIPGFALAAGIHSAFNHVLLPPLAMTALLLLLLPLVIVVVFQRSERATREWVTTGLDLDVELLQLVESDVFTATRFGTYLNELRARVGGMVAADMFCMLRLDLEIAVQAKALLLAREAGLNLPVSADLQAALRESAYLQRSIGRAGMLALKPLQVVSDRDRWHRFVLTTAGRG